MNFLEICLVLRKCDIYSDKYLFLYKIITFVALLSRVANEHTLYAQGSSLH